MPALVNAREELFAQGFVRHGNGTRAAAEAGYAPASSSVRSVELLRKPRVVNRITELREATQKATAKKVQLSRDWVIQSMTEIAQQCIDADDRPNAIRALQLLGNETGAFISTQKLEVKSSPLDGLSTQELRGLLGILDSVNCSTADNLGGPIDGSAQSLRTSPLLIEAQAIEIIEETGDGRDSDNDSDAGVSASDAGNPPPPGEVPPEALRKSSTPLNFLDGHPTTGQQDDTVPKNSGDLFGGGY
jgi:hypothetical protein